jgi:hypothetical protein
VSPVKSSGTAVVGTAVVGTAVVGTAVVGTAAAGTEVVGTGSGRHAGAPRAALGAQVGEERRGPGGGRVLPDVRAECGVARDAIR